MHLMKCFWIYFVFFFQFFLKSPEINVKCGQNIIHQGFHCCCLRLQWSSSQSLTSLFCINHTPPCTSAAASQNRPVGQCESFMARWMESVRENLFCPEQGRTLTQSLALRQESSAHLETAPKHEHNHTVARKRSVPPIL